MTLALGDMKYLFCMLMVFLSGFVVAINLSCLLPQNTFYDPECWKILFAIAIGVCFAWSAKHHV
jgi:hypothetical protein